MGEKDEIHYLPLYKAASLGDWDTAKLIFGAAPGAIVAKITAKQETALHVAVASGHSIAFVRNLVDLMSEKGMPFNSKSVGSRTVLYHAARAGNTEAAKIIVSKDRSLHMAKDDEGCIPLIVAAACGHKDTTWFLYSLVQNESPSDFDAVDLLNLLIEVNFYDIAIVLLKRYPHLVLEEDRHGEKALYQLAKKPQAFPSGTRLSYWQRVLDYCSSTKEYEGRPTRGDIENPMEKLEPQSQEYKGVHWFLKEVNNTKLMHRQALELLRLSIAEVLKSGASKANVILGPPLRLAARNGIHEFVTEVIKAYPSSVVLSNRNRHNVFSMAVIYRQEEVYNLLYQMGSRKHFIIGFDKNNDTILHLAAKYESTSRINRISGAALQMQRELQWYKEVEQLIQPSFREMENEQGKTPATLFTETHEALVKKGEKWMKEMANSCTLVATLVVAIVFVAAFTVPGSSNGGDDNNNSSNFINDIARMVFVISDALALFSSAASALMFLGILTARYSEEDFLKALPTRLAIGLITLFVSIASMLVAFSAGVNILLVHPVHWIAVPIGLFACIPVTLFAFLQFPLLVQIVASTFGRSIFGKQSDELFV